MALSDLEIKNLCAVEYVDIHGKRDEGSLEIHFSNTLHSNTTPSPHRLGTPTDEEWSDDVLLAVVEPLWADLLTLLCLFGGWHEADVIMGRTAISGPNGRKEARRAVDTGAKIRHEEWGAFQALLHVRRWQQLRDIETGYIDLYFIPDSDEYGMTYSTIGDDESVNSRLALMLMDVKECVERVARILLQDVTVALGTRPPSWEEDTVPVFGGDAYHLAISSSRSRKEKRRSSSTLWRRQRRLSDSTVDALIAAYKLGRSLPDIAVEFGIHQRTVAEHLEGAAWHIVECSEDGHNLRLRRPSASTRLGRHSPRSQHSSTSTPGPFERNSAALDATGTLHPGDDQYDQSIDDTGGSSPLSTVTNRCSI